MRTRHPSGTVNVSPPSRNPLKLRAPLSPVRPAMSSNVAVRDAVSAWSQLESMACGAVSPCARAPRTRPSDAATTNNELRTLHLVSGKQSGRETRLVEASTTSTNLDQLPEGLHPRLRQSEHEDCVAQRIPDLGVTTGRNGDEFLAVHLEHRRRGVRTGTTIELPQHRTGLGVV